MVSSDGVAPTFTWGVTSVPQGAARVFTTKGDLNPASNATTDGTITLVLPKSAIGNAQPGTGISLSLASVRATVPSPFPGTGGTNETIPDSTGAGSYALRPANLCLPNGAPIAHLAATPDSGLKPLTVQFDGSASVDPDAIDTIGSYTFNFGDGGDDVTQSSPKISHTYANVGLYPAKLVVTDSRGKLSSNTDQHLIEVKPTPTPTPTPTPAPADVTVTASPSQVSEGGAAVYKVSATKAVSQAVTVNYSMSGTASLGSDYNLSGTAGTVTIAAGQSSATVTLSSLRDSVRENKETATMTLQSGTGYKVGKAKSATVNILNSR
jgi:PKD repeat protein